MGTILDAGHIQCGWVCAQRITTLCPLDRLLVPDKFIVIDVTCFWLFPPPFITSLFYNNPNGSPVSSRLSSMR